MVHKSHWRPVHICENETRLNMKCSTKNKRRTETAYSRSMEVRLRSYSTAQHTPRHMARKLYSNWFIKNTICYFFAFFFSYTIFFSSDNIDKWCCCLDLLKAEVMFLCAGWSNHSPTHTHTQKVRCTRSILFSAQLILKCVKPVVLSAWSLLKQSFTTQIMFTFTTRMNFMFNLSHCRCTQHFVAHISSAHPVLKLGFFFMYIMPHIDLNSKSFTPGIIPTPLPLKNIYTLFMKCNVSFEPAFFSLLLTFTHFANLSSCSLLLESSHLAMLTICMCGIKICIFAFQIFMHTDYSEWHHKNEPLMEYFECLLKWNLEIHNLYGHIWYIGTEHANS